MSVPLGGVLVNPTFASIILVPYSGTMGFSALSFSGGFVTVPGNGYLFDVKSQSPAKIRHLPDSSHSGGWVASGTRQTAVDFHWSGVVEFDPTNTLEALA